MIVRIVEFVSLTPGGLGVLRSPDSGVTGPGGYAPLLEARRVEVIGKAPMPGVHGDPGACGGAFDTGAERATAEGWPRLLLVGDRPSADGGLGWERVDLSVHRRQRREVAEPAIAGGVAQ